ncbi:MAG: hypothetical protein NTV51_13935 [Verrucomicrobia bacterium]|nr:hypothetical protein [Verrucomicrobiota bacterium]
MNTPSSPDAPVVLFLGDAAAAEPEFGQLSLACRFYGLRLTVLPLPNEGTPLRLLPVGSRAGHVLAVLHDHDLSEASPAALASLHSALADQRIPLAVVGIGPGADGARLAALFGPVTVGVTDTSPGPQLWFAAKAPSDVGFELRGLGFPVGVEPTACFASPADAAFHILATVGPTEATSRPTMVRAENNGTARYLLARLAPAGEGRNQHGKFGRTRLDEALPLFVLLREAGGERCWRPAAALANLTIDDPWLTEPYGCLSYPGLLAEMQRERFHATIGFVPWNYDRYAPAVVELLRAHREHFSLAVHGNNHDRYEFYRYEARPCDNHRPKPLAEQAFNVRQALARMEAFERSAGLAFDRVMVFPHGICPAATLRELKRRGYWATYNYHNVPLGETPPADPVLSLRTVNADWYGFPAVRRAYPEKYPEEMIAIDLFLGNPVMFMGHQDTFFGGIDAFNPHARIVNARQPAAQWKSLGEISRRLHLLRWLDGRHCDVRLLSRHALVENPRRDAVEFHFAKYEPAPESVARITLDGVELPWSSRAGELHFTATLPAGASRLAEIHYVPVADEAPVPLRRTGLRRRVLRLIADFRDLGLANSVVGRSVTRKYYGGGKKRLTVGGLVSRLAAVVRGKRADRSPPSQQS